MTSHRILALIGLGAAVISMAACGSSAPPATTSPAPAQTDLALSPPTAAPQVGATQAQASATAQPTAEAVIPGRPSAPAGINDGFRSDPASLVAATGRPQLIEFFAFW